jgi:predicted transcriptional regulator of viral defense system
MNEVVTNIDKLREIAMDQHGFVTYQQAIDAGVPQPGISMLTKRDRLEKVAYGVYRVPQVPATPYDQFMKAVLWTGAPEACLSHDTALYAYDVSDINPTVIHVTVAKKRRIARKGGQGYVIHHQDLLQDQITWWEEIPIVTLPVAIEQCIDGRVQKYLIRQAIERGTKRGKLKSDDIKRLTKMLEERSERYEKSG